MIEIIETDLNTNTLICAEKPTEKIIVIHCERGYFVCADYLIRKHGLNYAIDIFDSSIIKKLGKAISIS